MSSSKNIIYLVEWQAITVANHMTHEYLTSTCRRAFSTRHDADKFCERLYSAARLLGTEVFPGISEMDLGNAKEE